MPELPEVETIARALREGHAARESIVGRTIARVEIPSERVVLSPSRRGLQRALKGARFSDVTRRGKTLRLIVDRAARDTDQELHVHLRMTGDLLTEGRSSFDRLRIVFDDGGQVRLQDRRHLAHVRLDPDAEARFADLGPEPFDRRLTGKRLRERLGRSTRPVKAALLDQRTLAGVGNIWADEALWRAQLHPATPTAALGDDDAAVLLRATRAALRAALKQLWSSGIEWMYAGADLGPAARVHRREGQPCARCAATIEQLRVAGRATYRCPRCQPVR